MAPPDQDRTAFEARNAPEAAASPNTGFDGPEADGAGDSPAMPAGADHDLPLDPASVAVARISGAIGVGVMSLAGLIAAVVVLFAAPLGGLPAVVLFAAVLVLSGAGAAAAYFWPAVRYRHIRYRVDAHGFTIRRGVFWRSVTSVPKSRVQHTDVSRGPVQRHFGLATLVIHTAGTHDASVSVSGLSHRAAVAVRDALIDGGDGRGG